MTDQSEPVDESQPAIWMENVPVQGPDAVKRILYLDAHDAFSRNIINFIETTLPVVVDRIEIDEEIRRFADLAERYDAIVAGSGPGFPDVEENLGLMADIWDLDVPLMGIGLGFQSLCKHFGAAIEKLPEPEYGARVKVHHARQDIFSGTGESSGEDDSSEEDVDISFDDAQKLISPFKAAIYQSHRVVLGHPVEKPDVDGETKLFVPGECKELLPLAWRVKRTPDFSAIIMGVRHTSKPLWGLQFHPESFSSSKDCEGLITSWWSQVQRFNLDRTPIDRPKLSPLANIEMYNTDTDNITASRARVVSDKLLRWSSSAGSEVYYREMPPVNLTIDRICEKLGVPYSQCAVLKIDPHCTVVAVQSPGSWAFEYFASKDMLHAEHLEAKQTFDERPGDIHEVIRRFMNKKVATGGADKSCFWGGLLGYYSYDTELQKYGITPTRVVDRERVIDVCFLWTERSIYIDREHGVWIQSLCRSDNRQDGWLDRMAEQLTSVTLPEGIPEDALHTFLFHQIQPENDLIRSMLQGSTITPPEEQEFRDQAEQARNFIQNGEVYRLFLATQANVKLSKCEDPHTKALRSWLLFKKLVKTNQPTCYAYMQIGPKIISLSSRVLMVWRREGWFGNGPEHLMVRSEGLTPEEALERAKRPPKTMAFDLAMNDLRIVSGSGDPAVQQSLRVSNSNYSLVTTMYWGFAPQPPPVLKKFNMRIKAKGPRSRHDHRALPECLPPFRTTGVPKTNAAKILADVQEVHGRGIHGGIVGYYDVGGCGEWHVADRAAFSFCDKKTEQELWYVGAGIQITENTSPDLTWNRVSKTINRMLGAFRSGG